MKLHFRIGNWPSLAIEPTHDPGLESQRLVSQIRWHWPSESRNEGSEYTDHVAFTNCRLGNYSSLSCCCFRYPSLYCFNGGSKPRRGSLPPTRLVTASYASLKRDSLLARVPGVNARSSASVLLIVRFLSWRDAGTCSMSVCSRTQIMLYAVSWTRAGPQGRILVLVPSSQRTSTTRDAALLAAHSGILRIPRNWVARRCVQCSPGYQAYDVDGGFS
jgi:hypothetical protein